MDGMATVRVPDVMLYQSTVWLYFRVFLYTGRPVLGCGYIREAGGWIAAKRAGARDRTSIFEIFLVRTIQFFF